jgi:hypothetical protein
MSTRDQQLVSDIHRVQIMTGQQLRRLHYENTAAGRRLARLDLARLVDWRVLARLERRIGGVRAGSDGYVYSLDALGQRLSVPGKRRYRAPWTPGAPFLRHAVAVAELYTQLRERGATTDLLAFDAEPICWRRFTGPGGRQLILKPDAFVICADHDFEFRYFIEVDCSTESLPRITSKAQIYTRYWLSGREQARTEIFPEVLWITPDDARRESIVQALIHTDAEHWKLFAVVTERRAVDYMLGSGDAK